MAKQKKQWYEYLWIASILYFSLGLFNILFAWIGLICFTIPLIGAAIQGEKQYCNQYCGRSQLMDLLNQKFALSKNRPTPPILYSKTFRYSFLFFFMLMFGLMIQTTYMVFRGADMKKVITLLWTFKLPWHWVNTSYVSPWIAQFAFGFYSVMVTSTILGFITMVLYRPRSWCAYCPMGTMTQGICQVRNYKAYQEWKEKK